VGVSESIVVLDDFLPQSTYDDVARMVAKQPLVYGSRSNFKTDPHGHWNRDFVSAGPHNLADVSSTLEGDESFGPVDAAWKFLRDVRLPGHVLIRCYLNGYTYGTEGYFHPDSERPDEHTAILYMNDYWEPDWAGETVFLTEGGDIAKAVLPRHNRAVIFPSNVEHAGRAVSRKCMILRSTLVFKARRRRSDDFEGLSVFLREVGAVNRHHQVGTLHDHLVRTFSLLEAKGLEPSVCFGGGLHAIYGTSTFDGGVLALDSRDRVISEFGERAEELAFLFSTIKRPTTLESPLRLDADSSVVELVDGLTLELPRSTFDDLRIIECANLSDQRQLARHQVLRQLWEST
jgi:SM-20-related protein